jgi:hypothetical protein
MPASKCVTHQHNLARRRCRPLHNATTQQRRHKAQDHVNDERATDGSTMLWGHLPVVDDGAIRSAVAIKTDPFVNTLPLSGVPTWSARSTLSARSAASCSASFDTVRNPNVMGLRLLCSANLGIKSSMFEGTSSLQKLPAKPEATTNFSLICTVLGAEADAAMLTER